MSNQEIYGQPTVFSILAEDTPPIYQANRQGGTDCPAHLTIKAG